MNRRDLRKLDRELSEFIGSMVEGMGRTERRQALASYVTGLLLDGDRKSIEPMAARLVDDASEIEAMRQRLQQAVVIAEWADDEMRARLARKLDAELPAVEALVVDDTGFPKKGTHSVGVARQYSGTLGRIDNCQVAVSLHLAGEAGSGCIAMRLFLPEAWAGDAACREKAGVPASIAFQKSGRSRSSRSTRRWPGAFASTSSWRMLGTAMPPSFGKRCASVGSGTSWACRETIASGHPGCCRARPRTSPEIRAVHARSGARMPTR